MTDTARTVSSLPNNTVFYWRVGARSAGGSGPFSSPWSFSTALSAPSLVAPPNNGTGLPLSITLIWRRVPLAATYRLQLGTDSTFVTGLVKNDSTITDTARIINGLQNGQRYFWRVSSKNEGGSGQFTGVWNFRTAGIVPAAVQLATPAPFAELGRDTVLLVWARSTPGVNRYWVELAVDQGFVLRQIDSLVADTTKVFRGLQDSVTYWWRVRAGNAEGWGGFSEVRRFQVTFTGVDGDAPLPRSFALEQNYPNPFNPTTTVTFALPREVRVRLEVYSTLGALVATLREGIVPAGVHQVRFDATGCASGLYLLRLSTNGAVLTKKMLLVR
jgi:hypothetical protein